ncbi:MAG: autotransporter outer membrane beta-barrel domain-containing protein [Burkholderiales bacterium]|jgi:hypothetical protein|nr:autotransporter outer membrane beta-barrel domain-containing protein [Burkholderiales bacterium]
MKTTNRLQRIGIALVAAALTTSAATAADYTATVDGAVPHRQLNTGDTVTVTGYSITALNASGVSGGQPNGIVVTGGGGITAANLNGGATGVVTARNGGTIDLGTGSAVQTEGYGAPAGIVGAAGLAALELNSGFFSSIAATNPSITVKSDRPVGAYAYLDGSIALKGTAIFHTNSNGTNGLGLIASERGRLSVENATITMEGIGTAWGENQAALWAQKEGQIQATGTVTMAVAGNVVFGAYADTVSQMTLNSITGTLTAKNDTEAWGIRSDGGTITVTGSINPFHVQADDGGATGAAAAGNGKVLLQGSSNIAVSGKTAYGLSIFNGGVLTVNDSSWNITGNSSAAIILTRATVASTTTIQINNSTLKSNQYGIVIRGGATNVALDHTTLVNDSGILIDVEQNTIAGALDMTAKNESQLSGTANVDAASTSNLDLQSNSQWTMTGDSTVTGLTQDNSRVLFSPPVAAAFKTLTALKDYTANNGSTMVMNTTLDAGAASTTTDRLVVNGNTGGTVALDIQNADGAGGLTTGNGIQIVKVQGVSNAVFTLAHPVVAGAYQYELVKVGNDWYLQSKQRDPGNPGGNSPASVPTLGSNGLILLIGLLGVLAFTARRRFF